MHSVNTLGITSLLVCVLVSGLIAQEHSHSKYPKEEDKKNAIEIDGAKLPVVVANDEAIWNSLDRHIDLDYDETPFEEVVERFRNMGLILILDQSAIDDNLTLDEPISFVITDVPIRCALKLMLEEKNATFLVRDNVVKLISLDVSLDPMFFARRVYNVRKLLAEIRKEHPDSNASETLSEVITTNVVPDDWATTNGDGTLTIAAGLLVVVQSQHGLEEVDAFLKNFAHKSLADDER